MSLVGVLASPRVALHISTRRATVWWPVGVASMIAVPVLGVWASQPFEDPNDPVWAMRSVAVLLALGVGFGLDDPALPSLAGSPASYARRRLGHLSIVLPIAAVTWTALLLAAGVVAPGPVPAVALSLEAASMCLVSLAVAAVLQRCRDLVEPGTLTIPVFLGFLLVVDRGTHLMGSLGPDWNLAHVQWVLIATVAASVLGVTARDPGRRPSRGPHLRAKSTHPIRRPQRV